MAEKLKDMSVTRRLSKAKNMTSSLISEMWVLLNVHANNEQFVYTDAIVKKIESNSASHAFRLLQDSSAHYEIIRLCSFWEDLDLDKDCIPNIVALTKDTDVQKAIFDAEYEKHKNFDPDLAKVRTSEARRQFAMAIQLANECKASDACRNIVIFRHKIAHHLQQTRVEIREQENEEKKGIRKKGDPEFLYPNPTLSDAKEVLVSTRKVLEALHFSINGTDYAWDETEEIARKRAMALWSSVTFTTS